MDPTLVYRGSDTAESMLNHESILGYPQQHRIIPRHSCLLERAKQRAQDYMATHMCALVFQPRPQLRAPLCSRLIGESRSTGSAGQAQERLPWDGKQGEHNFA